MYMFILSYRFKSSETDLKIALFFLYTHTLSKVCAHLLLQWFSFFLFSALNFNTEDYKVYTLYITIKKMYGIM